MVTLTEIRQAGRSEIARHTATHDAKHGSALSGYCKPMIIHELSLKELAASYQSNYADLRHAQHATLAVCRLPDAGSIHVTVIQPTGCYPLFWPDYPGRIRWADLKTWLDRQSSSQPLPQRLRQAMQQAGLKPENFPFFHSLSFFHRGWENFGSAESAHQDFQSEYLLPDSAQSLAAFHDYLARWSSTFETLLFRSGDTSEFYSLMQWMSGDLYRNLALMPDGFNGNKTKLGTQIVSALEDILENWDQQSFEAAMQWNTCPNLIAFGSTKASLRGSQAEVWKRVYSLRVSLLEKFQSALFYDDLLGLFQSHLETEEMTFQRRSKPEQKRAPIVVERNLVERIFKTGLAIEKRYPILTQRPLSRL